MWHHDGNGKLWGVLQRLGESRWSGVPQTGGEERRRVVKILCHRKQKRALLIKRSTLPVVENKSCLWYLCGQPEKWKNGPKFRNKLKEKPAAFERKQLVFGPSDRIWNYGPQSWHSEGHKAADFHARGRRFNKIKQNKKHRRHLVSGVFWSEWQDLNLRPLGPEPSAIPSFATPG